MVYCEPEDELILSVDLTTREYRSGFNPTITGLSLPFGLNASGANGAEGPTPLSSSK